MLTCSPVRDLHRKRLNDGVSATLQLQVESKQSCQDTIEILFQQQVLISVARRDVVSLSLSPR